MSMSVESEEYVAPPQWKATWWSAQGRVSVWVYRTKRAVVMRAVGALLELWGGGREAGLEREIGGWKDPATGNDEEYWVLRRLLQLLSLHGHSSNETACGMVVHWFSKLAMHRPLSPLTGAEDEWQDVTECMNTGWTTKQNLRCGAVFEEGGIAYYLDSITFIEEHPEHGECSFNSGVYSRLPIQFPWTQPESPHRAYLGSVNDEECEAKMRSFQMELCPQPLRSSLETLRARDRQ